MALWGTIDRANNAPMSTAGQLKKTANTSNRDALFNNVTADAYTTGLTVGVFGIAPDELAPAAGGVANVTVTAAGTGYTVRPTVTVTAAGDAGSGATATATAKLVSATITNGGADYAVADVLTINTTGAAGATATANLNVLTVNSLNALLSITVNAAGTGYTVRPTVAIGGPGTGATATATAKVVSFTVLDGGADYGVNDVLTINTTGAAGATATANLNVLSVNATGGILTVSVNTAGSFTTLPTSYANSALIGGNGTGGHASIAFGVNDVTVTANGTGYTSVPAITFGGAGGTGTTAVAAVNALGAILTTSVNTAGSFTTLPTHRVNNALIGGTGTSANATLVFGVAAVTVSANGTGYTAPPTITFGGTGGTGTTATSTLLSEQRVVPSAGWNLRTVFANGHVRYETLVATKNISSDSTDDDQLPE